MAGFTFVASHIWMGKNKPNKIKIPKAASLDVEGKNSPIPKTNSMAPTL